MNLLNNKNLLKNLLKKTDILNTVNGGVSMTSVRTGSTEYGLWINMFMPSVPPQAFNVVLNYNQLIVSSSLTSGDGKVLREEFPMFVKSFEIPTRVDISKIEAIYEDKHLKVILPFRESKEDLQRSIDIKRIE